MSPVIRLNKNAKENQPLTNELKLFEVRMKKILSFDRDHYNQNYHNHDHLKIIHLPFLDYSLTVHLIISASNTVRRRVFHN